MSGWKAVRTLNRDARINDGLSPYGYKSRYANNRANTIVGGELDGLILSQTPIRDALQKEFKSLLEVSWGFLTAAEQEKIDICVSLNLDDTNKANAEMDKIKGSIWFRETKLKAFDRKWAPRFLAGLEKVTIALQEFQTSVIIRQKHAEKANKSLNRIIARFDDMISDTADDLESRYVKTIESAKRKYVKKTGGRVRKNGTMIIEAKNWEDTFQHISENVIFLQALGKFVEAEEQEFLCRGFDVKIEIEKLFVKFDGKRVNLILPKTA